MFTIIVAIGLFASFVVRHRLKSTFEKWRMIPNKSGMTGAEIARTILDANGLRHVKLEAVRGALTDHYLPSGDVIRLSRPIYGERSVAAMAVAAHECGHAMQEATAYAPMKLQMYLAPLAMAGVRFGMILTVAGLILSLGFISQLGMVLFLGAMGLQVLSLPIEFNASRRALSELNELNLIGSEGRKGARAMLGAAAMTYVAGAAMSVMLIIALVAGLFRRRS